MRGGGKSAPTRFSQESLSRWQFCHAEMWKGEEKQTNEGALSAFSARKHLPKKSFNVSLQFLVETTTFVLIST